MPPLIELLMVKKGHFDEVLSVLFPSNSQSGSSALEKTYEGGEFVSDPHHYWVFLNIKSSSHEIFRRNLLYLEM